MTTAHDALPLSTSTTAASEIILENEFAALGLHPALIKALDELNFKKPTPVQAQAIPAFLAGRDLLVSSQTGSGKTAAFMLPALQLISQKPLPEKINTAPRTKGRRPRPAPARPHLIVLTPTRELAQQVTSATTQFDKYLRRTICASIVGGMPYPRQLEMLAKMPDILVATPGRLLDHMNSGRIDLSELSMLVFDEADRMLDMGFADDIDAIVGQTPETRQTLMFSATLDGRTGELAAEMLNDPVRVAIAQEQMDYKRIEQRVHYVDDSNHKDKLLDHLLSNEDDLQQMIIFTATKAEADLLADDLSDKGYAASALHGDMKQSMRNRTLQGLRRGEIKVLVATDVAARGIDVPSISHVVNYGLPKHGEDYIHRIGRTGRAGRSGVAINLIQHGDRFKWQRIERLLPIRVEVVEIEGLEPQRAPKPRMGAGRDGAGRNKERWSNDRRERRTNSGGGGRRDGRIEDRAFRQDDRPAPQRERFEERPVRRQFDDAPRFEARSTARTERFDRPAESNYFQGNSLEREPYRNEAPRREAGRGPRRFEDNQAPAFNSETERTRRPARFQGRDEANGNQFNREQPRRFSENSRDFGARPARDERRPLHDKPRRTASSEVVSEQRPRRASQEWVRR
ncbi:DEAD/DEAH box helicase [Agitococcus lubricus]|uniref:Superfamily II DNA/RNA helicase n=1 Tax=Agitococcus lubricus TaxID=1077255 RepID=A0A2T5IVS0_9GAMM|nr:DEAD/DEAH box helicase [Agitococcus lubricus]PTQ87991.1 superfamily II DNA/RNA helicase [Agitococcus lubricus]